MLASGNGRHLCLIMPHNKDGLQHTMLETFLSRGSPKDFQGISDTGGLVMTNPAFSETFSQSISQRESRWRGILHRSKSMTVQITICIQDRRLVDHRLVVRIQSYDGAMFWSCPYIWVARQILSREAASTYDDAVRL